MKKMSIQWKFGCIFLVTLALIGTSFSFSLSTLRERVLQNEAEAVADQVIAFRAWVAGTGMVWVNALHADFPDFLAKKEGTNGESFYGKNPALATRELSVIANKTALRANFLVTSDEYRQPSNKPDAFESKAITSFKASKDLKQISGFEGEMFRYARPIYVTQGCLKCHGKPEDAPPEVISKYGDKKAFNYKIGDVRGIVSVKLPSIGWKEVVPIFTNPIALGLFALAFLLNFFFIQRVIIRRLKKLTNDATAIAKGDLDKNLDYTTPQQSNDEMDHAYHAVNLLQRSMNILFKKSSK